VARVGQSAVVKGVRGSTVWWIETRLAKFQANVHESMALNPFLAPLLYELHIANSFAELGTLLLSGHYMTGHSTGFGKLVDEKILPDVFGTQKLSSSFRAKHRPFASSCFNEIDHLVPGPKPILLSMKMSRWTIQLTAAKELNRAFAEILQTYKGLFGGIAVGVAYGKTSDLSDKYDILRGINRGKNHDVIDLRSDVSVYSGREFWAWINGNEPATQEWVLDGILEGIQQANCRRNASRYLQGYTDGFAAKYASYIQRDGSVDWKRLLRTVNG
jgi:hypothetical protein